MTPRKPDSLRLQEIDVPRYSDNEVLLRTINVGIDGTDLEIGLHSAICSR